MERPGGASYTARMLVFIDESGDPGFKVAKGSSSHFVLTMVIFEDADAAREAEAVIEALGQRLAVRPEFKFGKLSYDRRDAFFDEIAVLRFRIRAITLEKSVIRSEHLRNGKETFYNYFLRTVMQSAASEWTDAKVVIDGSGDRAFRKALSSYLRRHMDSRAVRRVDLRDSRKDRLLQLADMCAGAIARSYNRDRSDPNRWRRALWRAGKIEDIWDFR